MMKAPYIPEMDVTYPEDPFEHIIPPVRQTELVLDENYPFLDTSTKFRFSRAMLHVAIFTLVFSLSPLRFGLKVKGRSILRKYRRLLQNGAMTVSNHIHRWDLLFVLQAVRYRLLWFPAWKENLMGPDRTLIRLAGGIPVPTDIHLIRRFNEAFDQLHKQKKWIHVFPESARWDYFVPIRPFKKGMFSMAYKYNLPVLPLAFSYRKPNVFFSLINTFRKKALPMITITIGEPIMPDQSLGRKEAVQALRKLCHAKIVELAGIEDNPYAAEGD